MTKRMNKLYYLSHPYTGDEHANFLRANRLAAQLLQRGIGVFSPLSHSHPIHAVSPQAAELWYALDKLIIAKTRWDGIFVVDGWEESVGCRWEVELFRERFCLEPLHLHEEFE